MMSWIGLHELADVISGITQKTLLYHIKTGHIKGFFCTCFVIWRANGH